MQNMNKNFCFTLDNISTQDCHGWYSRYDNKDQILYIYVNSILVGSLRPENFRQDVVDAGMGSLTCGFHFVFPECLSDKDIVHFQDIEGIVLYSHAISLPQRKLDCMQDKLIAAVEPFVEINIDTVRRTLLDRHIFDQYQRVLFDRLIKKDGNLICDELLVILADIKTTMHLLAAAYLETTRYADPDFFKKLPTPIDGPSRSCILVDMRGDITGNNWYTPEEDGRWAGPDARSSLLLPALETGNYAISIDVVGEIIPDALNHIQVSINETPISCSRDKKELPCQLRGHFSIDESNQLPFLCVAFEYLDTPQTPTSINSECNDNRRISIRVRSLSVERKK